MNSRMPEDPFVSLERKRQELVNKGVTGISLFVSKNDDATDRERATSMLNMLERLDHAVPFSDYSVGKTG